MLPRLYFIASAVFSVPFFISWPMPLTPFFTPPPVLVAAFSVSFAATLVPFSVSFAAVFVPVLVACPVFLAAISVSLPAVLAPFSVSFLVVFAAAFISLPVDFFSVLASCPKANGAAHRNANTSIAAHLLFMGPSLVVAGSVLEYATFLLPRQITAGLNRAKFESPRSHTQASSRSPALSTSWARNLVRALQSHLTPFRFPARPASR